MSEVGDDTVAGGWGCWVWQRQHGISGHVGWCCGGSVRGRSREGGGGEEYRLPMVGVVCSSGVVRRMRIHKDVRVCHLLIPEVGVDVEGDL